MATATKTSPIAALQALGQSVWMDFMSRQFLRSGELKRLIEEDGLRGVTSNPTIFDKAISHSSDYDDEIQRLVAAGSDADAIYQTLVTSDIQQALDLFRPTYDRLDGRDGFVSLEVSPYLAHDTARTLEEVRILWQKLNRPNAMIKIPGTPEGVPAIEEALYEGFNINVTLLFSVAAYEAVAHAYIRALQRRLREGRSIDRIASVASFFVSRIDTETDKRIDERLQAETNPARKAELESLKGTIAIANAKNAYVAFQRIFGSPEFQELKAKGARVQRVLWGSVSTKNPKYPDTLYVDELIGPDTVSTMPPETFKAFQDHGRVRPSLTEDLDGARARVERLAEFGIDFQDVTNKLLREGIASFAKSFDSLMAGIKAKREAMLSQGR
ncbi:MAG: transaldolase [Isosphaeraceae bacterium]|nr:transaldolase [Isosphaeraceae bacterium]